MQSVIDGEVKKLVELKSLKSSLESKPILNKTVGDSNALHKKISAQGDKVRELKSAKAPKDAITSEVNILLSLKSEYKTLTGEEWKPQAAPTPDNKEVDALDQKIIAQGDKVRQLKSEKAAKNIINSEVQALLALKEEYKKVSGSVWKPRETTSTIPQKQVQSLDSKQSKDIEKLISDITSQGDTVRGLKSKKADKSVIDAEVKSLLELKKKFKETTGEDYSPEVAKRIQVAETEASQSVSTEEELIARVTAQGDIVRQLKTGKASKVRYVVNLVELK